MSEMIERVARVLCIEDKEDPDATLGGDGINFLWQHYATSARIAIEAMREPTFDMTYAGGSDDVPFPGRVWEAMIDAALEEE